MPWNKPVARRAGWRRHVIAAALLSSAAAALLLLSLCVPSLPYSNSRSVINESLVPVNSPDFFAPDSDPVHTELPPITKDFDDLGVKPNSDYMAMSPSLIDSLNDSVKLIHNGQKSPPLSLEPSPSFIASSPSPSPSDNFGESVEESVHPDLKILPFVTESVSSDSQIGNLDAGQSESITTDSKNLPFQPEVPTWPTSADQELLLAKKELENNININVSDDPDLYAPLFRNVSIFKRSYELMEKILKVYIYQDGERPIFHTPELKGIYASEGWFMKLLEGSKRYVTKDPTRAHLFYLPYSSRRLEYSLYVRGSHTIMPLALFLKHYVEMLSAKYPFWNRTRGSDHFFVACHDWGPYTTKLHKELRRNTIKVLCNADVSEGIFKRGKDVSLPETFIKLPKRPQRDIGGKPVAQREILAFFAGQLHGRVRPILLKHWRDKDVNMKIYENLPRNVSKKMSYAQHMKSSKFCICPMGYEVNSPRIVESIYYECVPVIIADNFVLPFDEFLNWGEFSIVVRERDIPNLKDILTGIPLSRYIELQSNVKRVQRYFLWHMKPEKYDLFNMILHSVWFSRLKQSRI